MAWRTTAKPFESPASNNVYSGRRTVEAPAIELPKALEAGTRIKMDGLKFLSLLPGSAIPIVFFDPQYRGVLDKLQYGNEGESRDKARSALQQMPERLIANFVKAIDRVLIPSGHLFLWMDKFHLCQGFSSWLKDTDLEIVDLVSWNKEKLGMGYRTRRVTEYCVVLQRAPRKAKGVWKIHNIPDTWSEKGPGRGHPHRKPVKLQSRLIEAVSNKGDYVIDPAAGSFSVMEAANNVERTFLGCDLNG